MSKKHARLSPSKLENVSICPCFQYKELEGDVAQEGTDLHTALETGSDDGMTPEQIMQLDFVRTYVSNIKAGIPNCVELREVKVELKDLTYGFADIVLMGGDELHVMDAKFGRKGATHAEDNFQIQTYVAGLLEANPQVTKAYGHIIAPRADGITQGIFDRSIIEQVRTRIEELYKVYDDPFKKPGCDPDLCPMCANAARCPAMGTAVATVSRGIGLPVPEVFAPEAIVSLEDRALAHTIATALENWAEQIKKNNTQFVLNGNEIPGFKLVDRSTGYRVPRENTITAFHTLNAAGYGEEALHSAMTVSIPELAKTMADIRGTDEAEEKTKVINALGELASEGRAKYLQKVKKSAKAKKGDAGTLPLLD